MAENKKTFLAYADWMHTFDTLKDNEAGKLIKVILQYVNDQNPEPSDRLIKIAFEPIKQQLKRDLKKWEGKLQQTSEAGVNSSFNKFKNKILSNIENVDLDYEIGFCRKRLSESQWQDPYFNKCLNFLTELNESTSGNSTNSTTVENVATNSSVNVNDNVNDILFKEKNIKKEKPFSFRDEMLQNGFAPNLVDDWLKVRKTKKATNTETALKAFLTEIQKTDLDKNEILKICIEKSWSGFKTEWIEKLKNYDKNFINGSSQNGRTNGANFGQSAGAIKLAHSLAADLEGFDPR